MPCFKSDERQMLQKTLCSWNFYKLSQRERENYAEKGGKSLLAYVKGVDPT